MNHGKCHVYLSNSKVHILPMNIQRAPKMIPERGGAPEWPRFPNIRIIENMHLVIIFRAYYNTGSPVKEHRYWPAATRCAFVCKGMFRNPEKCSVRKLGALSRRYCMSLWTSPIERSGFMR